MFVANNLPQLPHCKIYELWLIPPGAAPIPAGLFSRMLAGMRPCKSAWVAGWG